MFVSVGASGAELFGTDFDIVPALPNSQFHFSFLTVPLPTRDYASHRTLQQDYALLLDDLKSTEGVFVGDALATWAPVEAMLAWAATHVGGVRDQALVGVIPRGRFDVPDARGRERVSLREQDQILRAAVQDPSAFIGDRNAVAIYMALMGADVFATRNSPLKFSSAAKMATAVAPGTVTAITDGSTVAVASISMAGILVTYIVIPALRGFGEGLEIAMRKWALRLGPDEKGKKGK